MTRRYHVQDQHGTRHVAQPMGSRYRIEFSPDAEDHLRVFSAGQSAAVLNAIERRLRYQPLVETRNRRPMRPNPMAPWELRVERIRVYYDVEQAPEPVVLIRAVGVKERNLVRIGREAIEL